MAPLVPPELQGVDLSQKIDTVRVQFKDLTRDSTERLLRRECSRLAGSKDISLSELHNLVHSTYSDLVSLGIVKRESLRANVDIGQHEGQVDVTFHAKEERIALRAGASTTQRGDWGPDGVANIPSIFGGFTSLNCLYSKRVTGEKSTEASATLANPRILGTKFEGTLGYVDSTVDLTAYSSSTSRRRAVVGTVTDPSGRHKVELESALRDTIPQQAPQAASREVFQSVLTSHKNSAKYSYLRDGSVRGNDGHPSGGSVTRGSVELGKLMGIGGMSFLRAELGWWSATRKVSSKYDVLATVSVYGGGLLYPAGGSGAIPLQEKFFLGGNMGSPSTTIRGFAFHGVGPAAARPAPVDGQRKHDALGGDAVVNAAASVSVPLPIQKELNSRLFGFCSLASVAPKISKAMAKDLQDGWRAAVGVGASVPLHSGLLEFTASHALRDQPTDVRERFQLGFRVNFSL